MSNAESAIENNNLGFTKPLRTDEQFSHQIQLGKYGMIKKVARNNF